jgi:hypothetical protein
LSSALFNVMLLDVPASTAVRFIGYTDDLTLVASASFLRSLLWTNEHATVPHTV